MLIFLFIMFFFCLQICFCVFCCKISGTRYGGSSYKRLNARINLS